MNKTIVGKVIEVGKMDCYPPGSNGNEVAIEIAKGQLIRVSGLSDEMTRWLAGNLYLHVELSFDSTSAAA